MRVGYTLHSHRQEVTNPMASRQKCMCFLHLALGACFFSVTSISSSSKSALETLSWSGEYTQFSIFVSSPDAPQPSEKKHSCYIISLDLLDIARKVNNTLDIIYLCIFLVNHWILLTNVIARNNHIQHV